MIRNLPQSLIETAESILNCRQFSFGHKKENHKLETIGHSFSMQIRKSGILKLDEAIQDWFKQEDRAKFSQFDDMQHEHHSSLNDDEIDSVKGYTYNSKPIHDNIHNNKSGAIEVKDSEGNVVHNVHLSHLDSAVSKNKLKEPLITYSGIPESPISHDVHWNSHICNKEYTSSTVDPVTSHIFAQDTKDVNGIYHIAKIHNLQGHSGLYIGHNHNLSYSPNEHEFLIPRNTTFMIDKTPEDVFDNNGKLTHKIWSFYRKN